LLTYIQAAEVLVGKDLSEEVEIHRSKSAQLLKQLDIFKTVAAVMTMADTETIEVFNIPAL
jgi:hypothetical protein